MLKAITTINDYILANFKKPKTSLSDYFYPPIDVDLSSDKMKTQKIWRQKGLLFIVIRAASNYVIDESFKSTMEYDPELDKILLTTVSFGVCYVLSISCSTITNKWSVRPTLLVNIEKAYISTGDGGDYDVCVGQDQDELSSSVIARLIMECRHEEFLALPVQVQDFFRSIEDPVVIVERFKNCCPSCYTPSEKIEYSSECSNNVNTDNSDNGAYSESIADSSIVCGCVKCAYKGNTCHSVDAWVILTLSLLMKKGNNKWILDNKECYYVYEPGMTCNVYYGPFCVLDGMSFWGRRLLSFLKMKFDPDVPVNA